MFNHQHPGANLIVEANSSNRIYQILWNVNKLIDKLNHLQKLPPVPVFIAAVNPNQPAFDQMRIDKGLVLQIEVAEQEVFFVMFQLVILQEDTLSLDFFGQIADRFVVREGFALDADEFYRQPVG